MQNETTAPDATAGDTARPGSGRVTAMLAVSLAVWMASLDTAVTNTALPTIASELGSSPAATIWVVTSYQLVMVAAILPASALGEVTGHRKVFTAGLLLFTVTSLLCGLAGSLPMLISARAAQGLGAAAIMGANTALVREIYPPDRLGHGLGINALVIALGLAGGPVIASGVLLVASWHWLFLLNIPLGLAAVLLGRSLPVRQARAGHGFNLLSSLLCAGTFGLFIYGLGEVAHSAFGARVAVVWGVSLLCTVWLIRRERAVKAPVLPVDLFRDASFSLSGAAAVCAYTTQGLALVALPFLLHSALGRSQAQIGLLIAPWPVMGAILAPVAGRLSDRLPGGLLGGAGLCCLGVGVGMIALFSTELSTFGFVALMALNGIGFGLFLSPNQRGLMASAPPNRSGAASGVLGTARLLGQASGAALVALGLSLAQGHGATTSLVLGAAFAAAGAVLAFCTLLAARRRG